MVSSLIPGDADRPTSHATFISVLTRGAAHVIEAIIIAVSLWNVWIVAHTAFHTPLLTEDIWTPPEHDFIKMKSIFNKYGMLSMGYLARERPEPYSISDFYFLQNFLAPIALHFDGTTDRYVLVQFCTTRQVKSVPGLVLLDDLGMGFGLYRSQQ